MRKRSVGAIALAGTLGMGLWAMAAAAPAAAAPVPASQMRDLTPDHWAYSAIQLLLEKYQVMEGFPDRTFRGNKTLTRYELAAALARVMAKVDERIANGGAAVNVDPGVNPEDLRTIARLQREFREELDALKARVDGIDQRVAELERRVRVSGSTLAEYRDVVGASPLTAEPSADFRVRTQINLDAAVSDELSFRGRVLADVYAPQSNANAFLRGPNARPQTDLYVPTAEMQWHPGYTRYAAGLGALRDHQALGSRTADPFKRYLWRSGSGGFGFVGTPGLAPTGGPATMPGGATAWLPGTNVLEDLVDPNNSFIYGPSGSLFSSGTASFGPFRMGLGFHRGAVAGPIALGFAAGGPVASNLPGLLTWQDGAQAVGTLGLEYDLFKLTAVASTPALTVNGTPNPGNNNLTGIQTRDKLVGIAADVGTDALSASVELAGQTSFAFNDFTANRLSARVGSENLLGTNVSWGLGYLAGNGFTQPTLGSSAVFAAGTTKSLFAGQADWNSLGLTVRTPGVFVLPSLYAAVQATGAGMAPALGSPAIGSGLTLGATFDLLGLPPINVEWSRGKFNALNAANPDNALWANNQVTADQLTVTSGFNF